MKQISTAAMLMIRSNNRVIGKLMLLFDKTSKTIENWMDAQDVRLTTPGAIEVIKEETRLSEEEILVEPEPVGSQK
jgi:Tfp pilus assembly major pilin PilA